MAIRKSQRRGKPCLVIDIRYTTKNGRQERFRKDAQAQTVTAAKAEEKRYLHNIARYGSPYEPSAEAETESGTSPSIPPESLITFAEVVHEFRQIFMVTNLKIATRRGYDAVFASTLLPKFGTSPITKVDGRAAEELDLELAKRTLALSTRNNIQIAEGLLDVELAGVLV